MSAQEHAQRTSTPRETEQVDPPSVDADKTAEVEKLKADLDDILDDIDDVLEENAAEFVNSYVQKGGQ